MDDNDWFVYFFENIAIFFLIHIDISIGSIWIYFACYWKYGVFMNWNPRHWDNGKILDEAYSWVKIYLCSYMKLFKNYEVLFYISL